jgi:Uma2 family endonuclease
VRNADPVGAVHYPESDGKPMAETETHFETMVDLVHQLRWHLAARTDRTHVAGNQLWYWVEGDPRQSVAPDVYVVVGVPQLPPKPIWKTWVDRCAPTVVFEVTSPSTADEDLLRKPRIYGRLGTQELFLFDPLREYLTPPLQVWRRVGEELEPAIGPERSEVLGLDLRPDGPRLELVGPGGERVPPLGRIRPAMERARRRAEQERERAEQEKRRADEAEQRAEQARERAEQAQERAEQERERAEQAQERAEQERQRAEQERERAEQAQERAERDRERAARLVERLRAAGLAPEDED